MRALLRLAESHGAIVLRGAHALGGTAGDHGFDVRLEHETIAARTVVNAAGLHADEVSRALGGESFTIYPVRGESRGAASVAAPLGQRARVSAPAPEGARPGRAPHENHRRLGAPRSYGPIPERQGRLRARPRAARGLRRAHPAAAAVSDAGGINVRRQRHPSEAVFAGPGVRGFHDSSRCESAGARSAPPPRSTHRGSPRAWRSPRVSPGWSKKRCFPPDPGTLVLRTVSARCQYK